MQLGSGRAHRRLAAAAVVLIAVGAAFAALTPSLAATSAARRHLVTPVSPAPVTPAPVSSRAAHRNPNLVTGSAYLVSPANLIDGHFYESVPGYADFGLTMDGAFALAATGDDRSALTAIVDFLDGDG